MTYLVYTFPFFRGFLLGILAMLIHEAGHMIVAQAIGVRITGFGVCLKGLYTRRETGTPTQNFIISLAGPLLNAALLAFWALSPTFAIANLCFAFFNLIPVRGSDGDRALNCWAQMHKPTPMLKEFPNRPAA